MICEVTVWDRELDLGVDYNGEWKYNNNNTHTTTQAIRLPSFTIYKRLMLIPSKPKLTEIMLCLTEQNKTTVKKIVRYPLHHSSTLYLRVMIRNRRRDECADTVHGYYTIFIQK